MDRKIKIVIFAMLVLNILIGFADAIPVEQWNKLYSCNIGGFSSCEASAVSVQQISDGSFVFAGTNAAYGSTGSSYYEGWLRKTNSYGTLLWSKIYTEPFNDYIIRSMRQTSNGYMLAGTRHETGSPGGGSSLIIKADINGNKLWAKSFGGVEANYVQQTSDGNYVFAGQATGNDAWLVKFNSLGNKIWEKKYSDTAIAQTVIQTKDGGFILTGAGGVGGFLLKTDSSGNKIWMKSLTYGPGNFVQQISDGGYIVTGTRYTYGDTYGDGWGIKTDMYGNILWSKLFDTTKRDDFMYSVKETKDGGFIFAGSSNSYDSKSCDAWLVKTSKLGSTQWNKKIGSSQCDAALSIQQTKDLGYVFVGEKGTSAWLQKLIEPYITVVSPNGGEMWPKGSSHTIKWSSTGAGSYVKIELLKGGYVNRVISSSTPNDGSYSWTISALQTYGTDYKIRITSISNPTIKDVSNYNFKIY